MKSGFLGWLTLLFIYLKLTNQVAWGWWAVASPMLLWFAWVYVVYWADERVKQRELGDME